MSASHIPVRFHTNLDEVHRYEKFPTVLAYRPMVGDLVRSMTEHGRYRFQLELRVCAVTINEKGGIDAELHLTGGIGQESVADFTDWYRRIRSEW